LKFEIIPAQPVPECISQEAGIHSLDARLHGHDGVREISGNLTGMTGCVKYDGNRWLSPIK